jgi:hypothetical protein
MTKIPPPPPPERPERGGPFLTNESEANGNTCSTYEMGPSFGGGGGGFIWLVMPSCLQLSSPCLSSLPLHASITKQIMAPRTSPPAMLSKTQIRVSPLAFGFFGIHYTVCSSSRARGVTKRCRRSWLTNSALVYRPKFSGGGGGVPGYQLGCPRK